MSYWIWLIAAGVLLAVELGAGTYYLLWIGAGAALTGLISLGISDLTFQLAFFCVITIVLLTVSRKWIKRARAHDQSLPSVDGLLGKTGRVLSNSPAGALGTVRIGVDVWSFKSSLSLQEGELVQVLAVESSILLVGPVEDKLENQTN